jgi:signal transduction histidine kinase
VAAAVGAALLLAFLAVLPFKNVQLPYSQAFIPIIDSTLFLIDLITAALFYAQYVVGRRTGLLILAMGYLFTALIVVPHLLMFPGAFTASGLLGANVQSAAWLYCFRYLGFPVAVITYTVYSDSRAAVGANAVSTLRASIVAVLVLVIGLTWLAAEAPMPHLMLDAARGGPIWSFVVSPALVVVYLTAIAVLWRRRSSVLDLWLLLALWGWFIEVLLLSLGTTRYSAFWYASVFGVVASCLVLIVLLYETTVLYARFALIAAERDRERDRQRLTLQVLAGSIAHELQQPLTAIVTNGEAGRRLLTQTPPDLRQTCAALDDITADARRASDTIKSVRASLTGAPQPKALINVSELLQETLTFMRSELRARDVVVQLEVAADVPPIEGNKAQLLQVLVNLVTNAIEAMLDVVDRSPTLKLRCSARLPDQVSVSIEDSGAGIPVEHLGRVFDPFFTTKTHGTGLGLALCKSIIEDHGGTISAAPGKQHGSIFQIVLPAGTGQVQSAEAKVIAAVKPMALNLR